MNIKYIHYYKQMFVYGQVNDHNYVMVETGIFESVRQIVCILVFGSRLMYTIVKMLDNILV